MNAPGLGRQIGDLVAYLMLPLACLLLPGSWGEGLLAAAARRGWVLEGRSLDACEQAARVLAINDAEAWRRRWRRVELCDARDCWFYVFGRSAPLLERIRVEGDMPEPGTSLVLLGLHWGPGMLALEMFRRQGLAPRFVYRGIDRDSAWQAPFLYLYRRLSIRAIDKACRGAAISTPGAGGELESALAGVAAPVLLLDSPPEAGRRQVPARLLGASCTLAVRGMEMLVASGAQCRFFSMGLDESGEGKRLRIGPPLRLDSVPALVARLAEHFDAVVGEDSAQWRLWIAAGRWLEPGVNT